VWRFRLVCLWQLNPVPASQVGFQQIRGIERFCVEGSNKRSDRGHSSNDLEFFTNRTFRGSFSDFRKLISAFHFFPRNNGRGVLTSGLARASHQLNSALHARQFACGYFVQTESCLTKKRSFCYRDTTQQSFLS